MKVGLEATVADFVATRGRFRGISDETVASVQKWAEKRWERFTERDAS